MRYAAVGWLAGLGVAGCILVLTTPDLIHAASTTPSPDAMVAAAAALVAWLVLGWLSLGVAITLAESLGLGSARRLRWVVPRIVRIAVRTSVGVGIVAGSVVGSASAHADDAAPPRWPSLDRPAAPLPTAPGPPPAYVVRTGDSLWSIAAAHLPAGAAGADVAREWPRWWRANRATIGRDPSLIYPGQVLQAPARRP